MKADDEVKFAFIRIFVLQFFLHCAKLIKMRRFLILAVCSFLWGCHKSGENVDETNDPSFQKAQQYLNENRDEEAFKLFNRVVESRPASCPESHFELGQLYLSVRKDPIFSIYHFRQYLIQAPEGKRAHLVLQMIETAKKEFARTLPLNDRYTESPEYLNLIEVLKQVRAENARLKLQLVKSRVAKEKATKNAGEVVPVAKESNAKERIYVVQNEDSLSKISLKMYGSAVKWNVIYDANRDVLPSANSLKIGMKLRIPPLKNSQRSSSNE